MSIFERENINNEDDHLEGTLKYGLPDSLNLLFLSLRERAQSLSSNLKEKEIESKLLKPISKAMNISVFPRYQKGNKTESQALFGDDDRDNIPKEDDFQERLNNLISMHGNVLKVLRSGEAFGEAALLHSFRKRNATIITNTDSQFITLSKKHFVSIAQSFQKGNKDKLVFLKEVIPAVEKIRSNAILQDYLYSFKNLHLKKGMEVVREGQIGDQIYILAEGFCTVEKTQEEKEGPLDKCPLTTVGPGSFIGDELLFGSTKQYKYTVKVKPHISIE